MVLVGNSLESLDNADIVVQGEGGGDSEDYLVLSPGLASADSPLQKLLSESLANLGVLKADCDSVGQNTALGVESGRRHGQAVVLSSGLDHTGIAEVVNSHLLELGRAVVDGVHGSHVSQEGLGSADVAGSLLTTDMLLTSLESQSKSTSSGTVLGDTNDTSWQATLAGLLNSHESGVRTTESQGNTKSLRVTKSDIGTPFTGRSQKSQGRQVSGNAEESALLVGYIGQLAEVTNTTVGVGVLGQNTNQIVTKSLDLLDGIGSRQIHHLKTDTEALSTAIHNVESSIVDEVRDNICLSRTLSTGGRKIAEGHGHGLGGGCTLIEQTGVGNRKTSEVTNHGLEVEQRLQTTLADLGLVRSVAGIPSRVLENVSLDDTGDLNGIVTTTVHPGVGFVLGMHGLEELGNARLAVSLGLNSLLGRKHNVLGNDLGNKCLQRFNPRAQLLEHGGDILVARTNVSCGKVHPWLRVLGAGVLHVNIGRVLANGLQLSLASISRRARKPAGLREAACDNGASNRSARDEAGGGGQRSAANNRG